MLTGTLCARENTITPARIAEAVRVMEEAAFVGVTDEWDESICLFHSMYGGKPLAIEFLNARPTEELLRSEEGCFLFFSSNSSFAVGEILQGGLKTRLLQLLTRLIGSSTRRHCAFSEDGSANMAFLLLVTADS